MATIDPRLHRETATSRVRNLLGLALVAALGCEIADFDVVRRGDGTIPRDQPGDSFELMRLDDLEIVIAEIEDTQGIGREDISAAELTWMTIEVLDPPEGDFAFVERIEIFAESPGLGRVRVAHTDGAPGGVRVIELDTDGVDLRDYIAAPHVTLTAVFDGTSPATNVHVGATANLNIGATVRGACDHAR